MGSNPKNNLKVLCMKPELIMFDYDIQYIMAYYSNIIDKTYINLN
jgi:hypothetical protein